MNSTAKAADQTTRAGAHVSVKQNTAATTHGPSSPLSLSSKAGFSLAGMLVSNIQCTAQGLQVLELAKNGAQRHSGGVSWDGDEVGVHGGKSPRGHWKKVES